MRLTELDAVFVQRDPNDSLFYVDTLSGAHGVQFLCPCGEGHSILVWFMNPVDCEPVPPEALPKHRWRRYGTTMETLTLAPSINAGCWHGFVKYGKIC